MARRVLALALLFPLAVAAACGGKDSPTAPSTEPPPPVATPTRVIAIVGSLAFGDQEIGTSRTAPLDVRNDGNDPLVVTNITGTNGITAVTGLSWTSGTIPARSTQRINVTFTPTTAATYSGTITVNANHTSGTNTTTFSGRGLRGGPIWTASGKGNQVFDMPAGITRLRVQGTWDRRSNSNFIMFVGGTLELNEILRETINYDGTHQVSGTRIEIVDSANIAWTITEIR